MHLGTELLVSRHYASKFVLVCVTKGQQLIFMMKWESFIVVDQSEFLLELPQNLRVQSRLWPSPASPALLIVQREPHYLNQ